MVTLIYPLNSYADIFDFIKIAKDRKVTVFNDTNKTAIIGFMAAGCSDSTEILTTGVSIRESAPSSGPYFWHGSARAQNKYRNCKYSVVDSGASVSYQYKGAGSVPLATDRYVVAYFYKDSHTETAGSGSAKTSYRNFVAHEASKSRHGISSYKGADKYLVLGGKGNGKASQYWQYRTTLKGISAAERLESLTPDISFTESSPTGGEDKSIILAHKGDYAASFNQNNGLLVYRNTDGDLISRRLGWDSVGNRSEKDADDNVKLIEAEWGPEFVISNSTDIVDMSVALGHQFQNMSDGSKRYSVLLVGTNQNQSKLYYRIGYLSDKDTLSSVVWNTNYFNTLDNDNSNSKIKPNVAISSYSNDAMIVYESNGKIRYHLATLVSPYRTSLIWTSRQAVGLQDTKNPSVSFLLKDRVVILAEEKSGALKFKQGDIKSDFKSINWKNKHNFPKQSGSFPYFAKANLDPFQEKIGYMAYFDEQNNQIDFVRTQFGGNDLSSTTDHEPMQIDDDTVSVIDNPSAKLRFYTISDINPEFAEEQMYFFVTFSDEQTMIDENNKTENILRVWLGQWDTEDD